MSSDEIERSLWVIDTISQIDPFKEIFNEYLKQTGIPPIRLAETIYVTPAAVSQWRTGVRFPQSNMIYSISKGLGLIANQSKTLRESWHITNKIRTSVIYLKEAHQHGDYSTVIDVGNELAESMSDEKDKLLERSLSL